MKLLVVVGKIVLALSLLSNVAAQAEGEKTKLDMEPPKHLDRKGLFVLTPHKVRELQVKSITTSDWLCEKDGRLTDRQQGAYVEYDELGRLIRFTGHVDQRGHMEVEYQYDKEGRILEEKVFSKKGEVRELAVRAVFDYGNPRSKEQTVYDGQGAMVSRARFSFDDAGRVAKIEKLDVATRDVLAEAKRTYDKQSNFVEELGAAGRTAHSLENNVLAVSRYAGPKGLFSKGTLHSVEQYAFDERGNLLSFFRKSGDGSFWDRFTYKLDEQGLPVEKIWSRLEYVLQDPYELTKYSYEFYK
ncbi:MAG: hypothetical protein Q7T29_00530 [Gallionella sp.]|nr:hypothetical protein [Gallionella sp.]